jgi:nitronate monooxygenase
MAGVQGSALAIAVSKAGGLASLPGPLLTPDGLRDETPVVESKREWL